MMRCSIIILTALAAAVLPLAAVAQDTVYYCDFDHPSDTAGWQLENGGQTNYWTFGTIPSEASEGGRLYVTWDHYESNRSNTYNPYMGSVVYAYRRVVLPRGVCHYSYDWRCNGEEYSGADSVDYLRVFLMPDTRAPMAGLFLIGSVIGATRELQALPPDCVPLDGGGPLCRVSTWHTMEGETVVEEADTFYLVFMWYNDDNTGGQPPAAVDNLLFVRPECPMPTGLYADPLTSTSFTLHWNDLSEGGATEWLVELDLANQTYGQGVSYSVNSAQAVFASLTPNTDYRVYVRTVCVLDTTDTVSLPVHTPCVPIVALPYVEDFESVPSSGFVPCWQRLLTGGSLSTTVLSGDGRVLRWSTAANSYRYAVLPGIDGDVLDIGGLQLSFRCRVNSPISRYIEVGVMTNPMDEGTFETVGGVRVDSEIWEDYVVEFLNYGDAGVRDSGQVLYIAIRDTGSVADDGHGSLFFDNVAIEAMTPCQQVRRLSVGQVGTVGALLEWDVCPGTVNEPDYYEVRVGQAMSPSSSGGVGTPPDSCLRLACTESCCQFSGLVPGTVYRAWVRAHCGDDSLSVWDTVGFTTLSLPCAEGDTATADTVQCDSGAYLTMGVPVSYYYPYSLCQSIYTADTLTAHGADTGLISGMDYIFTNNARDMIISIYVATTSASSYASAEDMEEVLDGQRVYGPALHAAGTSGMVHFEFDRPFSWDGVGNLVVTMMVNDADTSALQSSLFYGYSALTDVNSTVYSYLIYNPFIPANAASGSAAVSHYRPTVRFHFMQCSREAQCVAPTLTVRQMEPYAAHLEWIPGYGETSWDVFYKLRGDRAWTVAARGVDTNYYCLTPLEAFSSYEVRVVPLCGDTMAYARATFSTQCAPVGLLPLMEDFEHFTASLVWEDPFEPCWHRSMFPPFPFVSNAYAHSGQWSMGLHTDGSTRRCYIATPVMDMDVSTLQVQFFAYDMGRVGYFPLIVGVMDDPDDCGTFVEVARVTNAVPQQWVMHEVPLDSYRGEGRHVALMTEGWLGPQYYNMMYVDDLTIDLLPSCPRPRMVTVDRIGLTTAVVQWDGNRVRNYEVEYGPAGFVLGTGSVVGTTLDSVRLTGLSHSTRYDVYVRAICGEDSSQRSLVVSFVTECGEIESLPYVQDFAHLGVGEGSRPPCWECGGRDGYPYVVEDLGDGSQRRLFCMPASPTRAYAILPAVDTVRFPLSSLQVSVRAHSDAEYSVARSHYLIVGVCQTEGDMLSFSPIDTIALTPQPVVYEVPLVGAVGLGRYVTFVSMPLDGAYHNTVYLDSVAIEPIGSCQRPYSLTANSPSATTAHLAWRSRGASAGWQVEYMPHGAALGTGTRLVATTSSLAVAGLTPATGYDFYVRNLCPSGDTSEWCSAPGYFVTQQVPASVPYDYDFASMSEWGCWQTLSNGIGWYRGTVDGRADPCMYISADSGSTRSTLSHVIVNAVAYRDIDFGTVDTSFVLSFRAIIDGVHTGNLYYDGLAVFLTDPALPVLAPSAVATQSPWGQLGDLVPVVNISGAHPWSDYSAVLDSISGVHRLVFYWYGCTDYSPLLSVVTGQPAAISDVSIQHPQCQRPYSVRATNVTAVSAIVRWHGDEEADYRVQLYETGGALLSSDTVHDTHFQYLNLLPGTTYKVRVSRLCDGSVIHASTLYVFSTLACSGGMTDTVGNPQSMYGSYVMPIHLFYPYSYTQQIILASELQGRGEITAINFLYGSSYSVEGKTNCTIYLGHTTLSEFSSTSDVVPSTDLMPVYIGNLNCSRGWNRIVFDSPFPYDGSSNIVVAIDDNSQHRLSGNRYFVTTYSNSMTVSFYSDSENIDCSSAGTLHGGLVDGALCDYRCVMTVEMCPSNSCLPPQLLAPRVSTDDVTVRWRRRREVSDGDTAASRYLFGYRRADRDFWIENNVPLTDTSYTVTRFEFGYDYVYHVRQYCDTTSVSNWAMGSFNTADIPCLPPLGLQVSEVTGSTALLRWTPDGNNISYRVHVWGPSYDTIANTILARCRLWNLNPAARYRAAVEVTCEYVDEPSQWSDTITFETATCPDATGLAALEVGGNSVLLDWEAGSGGMVSPQSWQVEWGLQGFDQGTGVMVEADHHPFLLTGLTGETTYDIVVRSVCGDSFYGENWTPRLTVTTTYSGIGDAEDDSRVQILPNPTTADVVLHLPAACGVVRVEVVDMAGRVCLATTIPNQTTTVALATSQLPQGAYYVRVTGGRINVVRRIIKLNGE